MTDFIFGTGSKGKIVLCFFLPLKKSFYGKLSVMFHDECSVFFLHGKTHWLTKNAGHTKPIKFPLHFARLKKYENFMTSFFSILWNCMIVNRKSMSNLSSKKDEFFGKLFVHSNNV